MNEAYEHVRVEPLAGALGAEIHAADLAQPLPDAAFAEIERALDRYLVVFFRGQRLTPELQCAFTARFGRLVRPASTPSIAGFPDVTNVVREADAPRELTNFGGVWHSDQSFRERPSGGFTLRAVELPPLGGDTMFANLYLAYETLSAGMREMLDRLIAVHSFRGSDDPDRGYGAPAARSTEPLADEVEHPLIRIHPHTGRKLLYVSGSWIVRFKGMTPLESRPLLDFLHRHAARPEFTVRYRWTPGDLALLDNRCTQHFAINDYPGFRRVMHRVMFAGERPYGPALPQSERPLAAVR